MIREAIFDAISDERLRQQDKFGGLHAWGSGDCSSHDVAPMTKVGVLTEELGEVARAVLDKDTDQLEVELVQLAAVAVAWLESI